MIDPLLFKHEFSPHAGWLSYGVVILLLLVMIVFLAKNRKPFATNTTDCKLIEKKHVGHKTVVYVMEYQQQRFILADNQQALAIYPLMQGDSNETP